MTNETIVICLGGSDLRLCGQLDFACSRIKLDSIQCRLIVSLPFSALSIAATVAPRIEIYTILACSVQKPEYNIHPELSNLLGLPIFEDDSGLLVSHSSPGSRISPLIPIPILSDRDVTLICLTGPLPASNYNEGDDNNTNRCSSEPEVQAAVAKLTAGE